jgi:ketosteroid isomerase-like protein
MNMSPVAVPQSFRDINRVFEEQVVGKGDFDALQHVYTRNATILPPGSELVSGIDGIKAFWKGAAAAMGVTALRLYTLSLEIAGDTAYEIGRAEIFTGGPYPTAVKYVVVWKNEEGAWKWHVDIWNTVS